MNYNINFPGFGIYFKKVYKYITIFDFKIYLYGIVFSIATLLGIFVIFYFVKKDKQDADVFFNIILISLISGIIGARLFYVIFRYYEFTNIYDVFNIREGGLAIYGGLILSILVVYFYSKKKFLNFWLITDYLSIGVLISQIIGRLGNFFNREIFGSFTKNIFRMELPIDSVNISYINNEMLKNTIIRNGIQYISVNPVFLYEIILNFICFVFILFFRKYKKFNGEIGLIYLIWYGLIRFLLEFIRMDKIKINIINISQLISSLIFIISCFIFVNKIKNADDRN